MPLTFTPIQNDLDEANTKLKALYDAYNALEQKVNSGTTTAASTEGQIIKLADQSWWKIIQPTNYATVYSNGSKQGRYAICGYRINPGINFSTADRPDTVFTIAAYNILTPNGSREFQNEAGWDETVETHYDNPGFLPYGDFEWHKRMYTTKFGEVRLHSIYVNKTTGQNRQDFGANGLTLNEPQLDGSQPRTWEVGSGSMKLNRLPGQNAEVALWDLFKFSGTGGVPVIEVKPDGFGGKGIYYGYGKLKIPLPIYTDNTAARSAGREVNEWYQDNNGFVRIVK